MAKAASVRKTVRKAAADNVRVAVVGAGLAGLTSALRLAERGFKVTLYEATDTIGGNLSSDEVNGVYHDVYPHMFCAWYSNFWQIFETDLGLSRDVHFEPRMGVKLMEPGSAKYLELENATTVDAVIANLTSGVLSIPDMFLLGYSMLDLAATPFDRTSSDQLEQLDVNGFIYSRGYSTEKVAKLQNYILMVIWSIQSETTSAASYQDFIKHTLAFPHATPFAWLLKGSLSERIAKPFEDKLLALGCDIQKNAKVSMVRLADGAVRLTVERPAPARSGARRATTHQETQPFDHVVLAVPAPALAKLVLSGEPGDRIVDALPHLAELQHLRGEAIPVVDVYFNRKLPDIPPEQVALTESDCDLTMLDLSQLWTGDDFEGRTALVLAASNGLAIPSADPLEQGHYMIRRLHDYLPVFEPGAFWGDPKSDICWEKTHFRSNADYKLFLNEVGSWYLRPVAAYPEATPNVFFAGDFCQTDVDMATIEAAVQSGLLAAQAVQRQDQKITGKMRGDPITTAAHEVYSDATFLAARLALMPFAYAATAWSAAIGLGPELKKGPLSPNAYSPATYSLLLPLAFTLDWWKTAYWLARRLTPGGHQSGDGDAAPGAAKSPESLIGLGAKALSAAGDLLHSAAARQAASGENHKGPDLAAALSAVASQLWRTAQTAYAANQPTGPAAGPDAAAYQRRWRAKR